MASRIDVTRTLREDGTRDGLPVVVLEMVDVTGGVRQLHLSQEVAMGLLGDLGVATRQLARSARQMPSAWQQPSS